MGRRVDISMYQGLAQFGPAYRVMLENDAHAKGSVDRVLMENMVRLCTETADYLYSEYTPTKTFYGKGARPQLEHCVEKIVQTCDSDEKCVEAIARFTSQLKDRTSNGLDSIRVGGTEEAIIARGSDWCADVARVGCALCQVAGYPARIVYLVDTEKAYSGHVIMEVFRARVWGAVDPLTDVLYRHSGGSPASTWALVNDTHLVERHFRGESTPHTTPSQFRAAAISNHFLWEGTAYDYTVIGINEYYRSILEMSEQGWPCGLRWLHGEDG